MSRIILGIAAPMSSGKSSIAEYLEKKGFNIIRTTSILEELLTKRNILKYDRQSLKNIFVEINSTASENSFMNKVISVIKSKENYAIDSIRLVSQNNIFRTLFNEYRLLFLDTPLEERYILNSKRKRFEYDASQLKSEFLEKSLNDWEKETNLLKNEADICIGFYKDISKRIAKLEAYLEKNISL